MKISDIKNPQDYLFMVPMRPVRGILFIRFKNSSDKPVVVPAEIVEGRHKIDKKYKIQLKSVYEQYGSETFYQSDLDALIAEGHVKVYKKVK
jgi:hypothetical protein